ncbi:MULTISPECIES: Zn-ribbon domain-containing OB-fold protein [unclassified Ruegeria]|uniref:Zn-ribbon domain-containing OB-fold protein n=1 Tax=unclassified Ruegeria TaxID=2625375 RepID=UPI0014890EF2|nr:MULTISPECIES: zinc ribbon domain-containing protein [unclassified Ruegeria]
MKHQVSLDYSLAEGWLAPWIEGLRQGKAIASHCKTCGGAQFPPLRVCPDCRTPSDGWVTLSGRAAIQWRTTGADGDFAVAKFEGAHGATVLRSAHLPPHAAHGRLRACAEGPPILQLEPEPDL